MKQASDNYNDRYFECYRSGGLFGAGANRIKFDEFVKPGLKVLDFGCAAGDLLASYSDIDAYGVEINPAARSVAEQNGLTCFASSGDLPDDQFDLVISDNALEHAEHPLQELRHLHRSLKPGGTICIVVPLDHKSFAYKTENIDYHLFSWSPMNLGNLLDCAGFSVLRSEPFVHKWMPGHQAIVRVFGWNVFHLAARVYGRIDRRWCQTRAVAVKS
ncbi:MAG: class I SAM-dependent methyltransferase [Cyanobium sp.]|jgi:SAM-dependent methyltransferase